MTTQKTLPKHIGFIMDGNRRWARKNKLKAALGHDFGVEPLMKAVEYCSDNGIKYVTAFAFSEENWERSKEEVSYLMQLVKKVILEKIPQMNQKGVRLNFIGRKEKLPPEVLAEMMKAEKETAKNNKITLNIAFSYGGRAEIVDAVKKIIDNGTKADIVTEELISENVYEAFQPDIDLVVRTSGIKRLSGFMLWQTAYAELYFTDIFWPEFNNQELEKALNYYDKVKRNFGK